MTLTHIYPIYFVYISLEERQIVHVCKIGINDKLSLLFNVQTATLYIMAIELLFEVMTMLSASTCRHVAPLLQQPATCRHVALLLEIYLMVF